MGSLGSSICLAILRASTLSSCCCQESYGAIRTTSRPDNESLMRTTAITTLDSAYDSSMCPALYSTASRREKHCLERLRGRWVICRQRSPVVFHSAVECRLILWRGRARPRVLLVYLCQRKSSTCVPGRVLAVPGYTGCDVSPLGPNTTCEVSALFGFCCCC